MAKNEEVISIIENAVDSEARRQGHQGDYGLSCPFCNHPESKKKLWVNFDPDSDRYGWWRCWVCDESGKSLFTLLKKTNASEHLFKRLGKHIDAPKKYENGDSEDEEEEEFTISLPQDFRPLWKEQNDIVSTHALNRLKDRGLSYGDVVKHEIGYCRFGDYKKRIIIPSFGRDRNLNYFVGRAIWSSQYLKYKNPPAPRDSIVPFGSMVNWREPVTLVEGPFDAIACRRNAVPLLGNNLPESLACRLIEADTEEIRVALDADMKSVALKIAERFLGEGFTVKLIELPDGKDPGDIGFEGMAKRIKQTEPLGRDDIISHKLWT